MHDTKIFPTVHGVYTLLQNYSSQVMTIVFDIHRAGGIVLAIGGA
jgi:hypothetical protein